MVVLAEEAGLVVAEVEELVAGLVKEEGLEPGVVLVAELGVVLVAVVGLVEVAVEVLGVALVMVVDLELEAV